MVLSEIKFSQITLNICSRLSVIAQFLYAATCLFLMGEEGDSLLDTKTISMMVFLSSPVIMVHGLNWLLQTRVWPRLAFISGAALQIFIGGVVLPALKGYTDTEQAFLGAFYLLFWYIVIHSLQDPQGEVDRIIKLCNTFYKINRRWYFGVLGVLVSWTLISAYSDKIKSNQMMVMDDQLDAISVEMKKEMDAQKLRQNIGGVLSVNPDKQADIKGLSKQSGVPTFSIDSPENEAWVRSMTNSEDNTDKAAKTNPASQ